MTTLSELRSQREAAGARYAAAVAEFRAAFVELGGIDQALQNTNVSPSGGVASFGIFPDMLHMRHPDFVNTVGPTLQTEVIARREQLIADFEE